MSEQINLPRRHKEEAATAMTVVVVKAQQAAEKNDFVAKLFCAK